MQSYRKQVRAVCSNLCIIACIMALSLAAAGDVFGADKDELYENAGSVLQPSSTMESCSFMQSP